MKRWAWLMVLAAVAAPGCVILPQQVEQAQQVEEAQRRSVERKKMPPVKGEEINESNARASYQRLVEEVEQDQNAK
jgi:hypothetical protein